MSDIGALIETLVGHIEYDFCEDELQGNWNVSLTEDVLTIEYEPFSGLSYSTVVERYRLTRIE